jgi:uncharacterized membrane-anchored protein
MLRTILAALLLSPVLAWSQGNPAVLEEMKKLQWQVGPTQGRIGNRALIAVPQDHVFLDERNTRRFLELTGNPPRDGHYLFAPSSLNWFAVFSFDASGYVKDDEKIDADALLKTLKASDAPSNDERKRLGMEALYTEGWQVPPHYDLDSKRLEWGMRLRTASNHYVINYSSRLLGRSGVMSAVLVADPETLAADTAQFKSALKDFSYVPGEKYSEFKAGDRIAEYGLAALIVGGAAAVASKKGFWSLLAGFFAAFWKVLAGLGVAALAGLGSIFKRKQT